MCLSILNFPDFFRWRTPVGLWQEKTKKKGHSCDYTEQRHDWKIAPVYEIDSLWYEHNWDGSCNTVESDGQSYDLNRIQFCNIDEEDLQNKGDEESHDEY